MLKKFNKFNILQILTILIIFVLPYFLFEGKLFIGGDDTRLQYLYPEVYLEQIAPFSWNRFASLGWSIANQFYLPYLVIWSLVKLIIGNLIVINYLAFSLPLLFSFTYFYKFLSELISDDKYKLEIYTGTLFFIFSPIIIYDQFFIFLSTIWLLGLIPFAFYYFLKYLKTANFINVFKAMIGITVFSLVSLSVPWALGLFMPLGFSMIILLFLFTRKEIILGIKRAFIFLLFIGLSQSFWFFGYFMSFVQVSENSVSAKVFNKGFQDTFSSTVLTTASGQIFNPLLNLFHRQIALDFEWDLKNIFLNFYDKTYLLNLVFIFILAIGLIFYKKYLSSSDRRIFLIFVIAFVISLYFFTVNIGPLKNLFILLGSLPGFTMFRNFSDKFSLGYVFLYSTLITFSLIILKKKVKNSKKISIAITPLVLLVILINIIPIKRTVNSPLWKTDHTYKTINIPQEYLDFMQDTRKSITPNNIILSVPFGASVYTVIKDADSENVYLGTSPVVVFSGVSDMSGYLSFNFTNQANVVNNLIIDRKYDQFNEMLYNHNINYVFVTKNIPKDVKESYAFFPEILKAQDEDFMKAIAGEKILTSSAGNYELYSTKKRNAILKSNGLHFQRVNPTKYRLYIRGLKNSQSLSFLESFHGDWNIYLAKNPSLDYCFPRVIFPNFRTVECQEDFKIYDDDISFLFKKSIFEKTHTVENEFSNKWQIDPNYIKNNYDKSYYTVNKDGSINIELDLYFMPQIYFYLGLGLSIFAYIISVAYLFKKRR